MENPNSTVGMFDNSVAAAQAIQYLQHQAVNLSKLSILAMEQHGTDHAAGYCMTGSRLRYWGRQSTFWENVWGLLVGAGLFWAPSVGPVLAAGPLVALTAGALESGAAAGGLGAVGAGLYALGIPKHAILRCESAIRDGKILLLYIGSGGETDNARKYFEQAGATETHVHVQPATVGV